MKNNAQDIFGGAEDIEVRTEKFHNWLKELDDDTKLRYAINWNRIPHTLFNLSCKFFYGDDIQNIDWFKIHKSKDLGVWSHGGKVIV